ncbi:phosphotransferase family protein [Georgenia ruanii]|uniref:Phosphotransferase n=1 Tax=Georgenia ruanii TaxID=348442 RepID=A0A7J9UV01_9MICO|nr:phosphotransferase family protein [Georgenia ruanii]MPV88469.1 phosphotransferase [Georgenia ruanii]
MSNNEVAAVRPGEDLDWARLDAWLKDALPQLTGDFSVLQFPKGSANLTYQVTVGATKLVVRRPPFGRLANKSHDMGREYLVLSRLHAAYDRAPRALTYCSDPAVIGAEFFVSEYRPGVIVWDHVPEALSTDPDAVERVGFAVVDALAELHEVNAEKCGLGDLGRPDGYLDRQLSGWARRWADVAEVSLLSSADETAATMREVAARLLAQQPTSQLPGIVHNDFKIDNCQFTAGLPDRVYSVFDWDMATLGDPLCDLGTLLNYWPDHTLTEDDVRYFIAASATRALRLPSRSDIVERYAKGSRLDLSDVTWYEALGCWKTAVILQQLYARSVRGETSDERMRQRGEMVAPLARRAVDLLGGQV